MISNYLAMMWHLKYYCQIGIRNHSHIEEIIINMDIFHKQEILRNSIPCKAQVAKLRLQWDFLESIKYQKET